MKFEEIFKDEKLTPSEKNFLSKSWCINEMTFKDLINIFKKLEYILKKYEMDIMIFDENFVKYDMIKKLNKIWNEYDMDEEKVNFLLDYIIENLYKIKNIKRKETLERKINFMLEKITEETEQSEAEVQTNLINKILSNQFMKNLEEAKKIIQGYNNENELNLNSDLDSSKNENKNEHNTNLNIT